MTQLSFLNVYQVPSQTATGDNNDDSLFGLVMHGVDTNSLTTGVPKQVFSLEDVENLGITATYDQQNDGCLAHYHFSEFYRLNPRQELWFVLADPNTVTFADLADPAKPFAMPLIRAAEGRIRYVGIAFNPSVNHVPVAVNGLDGDTWAAIDKAEALVLQTQAEFMPIAGVVVEGRFFNGLTSSAQNLKNLTADAPHVSVLLGADHTPAFRVNLITGYVGNLNVLYHAAIGTFLGKLCHRKVHEDAGQVGNLGETESGDVQSPALGKFLAAGLSNDTLYSSYTINDFRNLTEKGYLLFYKPGYYPGTYLNGNGTCIADSSFLSRINFNRVACKAIRNVLFDAAPFVKKTVAIENGLLVRSKLEAIRVAVSRGVAEMKAAGEISNFKLTIDPAQNLLITKKLVAKLFIQPVGVMEEIEIPITLAANI